MWSRSQVWWLVRKGDPCSQHSSSARNNSLWSSLRCTRSPSPLQKRHHSDPPLLRLLFSSGLPPSFLTSFPSPLFSFGPHHASFFSSSPPSILSILSPLCLLIKLAGALIKCSSRPPPVGLGRALIPSPVVEALKSTGRENASFFNFTICIIPPLHSHMFIRVEVELICCTELRIGIIIIQSFQAALLSSSIHSSGINGSLLLSPSGRHHCKNQLPRRSWLILRSLS